jgi:hypothetical protein
MGKIICVAGYKAFVGLMKVFINDINTAEIYGDWVYTPETDEWLCDNQRYPASICRIESVDG